MCVDISNKVHLGNVANRFAANKIVHTWRDMQRLMLLMFLMLGVHIDTVSFLLLTHMPSFPFTCQSNAILFFFITHSVESFTVINWWLMLSFIVIVLSKSIHRFAKQWKRNKKSWILIYWRALITFTIHHKVQ